MYPGFSNDYFSLYRLKCVKLYIYMYFHIEEMEKELEFCENIGCLPGGWANFIDIC